MRMFIRKILWYHWNEYSNHGTKCLWAIIIIASTVAGVVVGNSDKVMGSLFFGGVAYLMMLLDRGFGEPTWESKKKSLGLH